MHHARHNSFLAGLSKQDLRMSIKARANKNHNRCYGCLQLYISIEIDIIYLFWQLSCKIPFADNPGTTTCVDQNFDFEKKEKKDHQ